MKNECNIVRDLLPLYAENMVSDDTAAFVEEHFKECDACKKEYEKIKEPRSVQRNGEAASLQKLGRKLKIIRIRTVVFTAVFVTVLLVSAFAAVSAPIYSPYSEGLVTVEKSSDSKLTLIFDGNVTDFDCDLHDDPEYGDARVCDIEAWTTLWDKWFSKGGEKLSTAIECENKPLYLFYVPNDGGENICLAKYDPKAENQIEPDGETKGVITLPRLVLGYYLILAFAALILTVIVWLSVRKRQNIRLWTERVALYPVAYIISYFIISGINPTSYSINRDFSLAVFLSLLIYGGLLLAHNIWYLKKDIKAINRGKKF